MINRTLNIAALTALIFVGLQRSAAAAYTIASEGDFVFYMGNIANGTIDTNSSECKDPSANYDKYCYIEITKSFTLTNPIKIPARVHLVGVPTNGQKPVITASYDVALNKSKPPCILNLTGDQAVLENVTLNAFTYRSTLGGPFNVDNAICMNGSYGLVKNVTINSPSAASPIKFMPIDANGIAVVGKNNFIQNNTITLKTSVGLVLNGSSTIATHNTITTNYFSILVQNKDPGTIKDNSITGKISFLFPSAFDILMGQAANILLLNTYKDTLLPTDPEKENQSETFEGRYQKTLVSGQPNSMPQCSTCKGISGDEKVLYADDGTCKPIPASGACMEISAVSAFSQIAIEKKPPDSELQVNQSTKQPNILPATTPTPGSELEAKSGTLSQPTHAEPSDTGGCNLIR